MKLSYGCMANIKPIINMHNKEVITEKKTQAVKCNCINKPDCLQPMPNYEHNRPSKIYIKPSKGKYYGTAHERLYYRTSKGTFKQRYRNYAKSLNHEKHRTDAELSKEYWRLKELKAQPQVKLYILKRCQPTKTTGICDLCLKEKLFIIEHQEMTF